MRKQDYYEPSIGRESEPRRRPKKKKKRANRGERVVVTLLSLLFLTVAIVATVKYVVRAPEPVTDNEDQQTQQDGTAEDSDAIQTISNGKERKNTAIRSSPTVWTTTPAAATRTCSCALTRRTRRSTSSACRATR